MLPCAKCKAECCYSPALIYREYERLREKLGPGLVHEVVMPNGTKLRFIGEIGEKCPLLKGNCCGIYDDRPEVCRKFGEVPEMRCPKLKGGVMGGSYR